MNEKFYGAFMGAITGNALGNPFEGMTRGHIASHFKTLSGYTDPEPALKQHITRWRKPGLYGATSQIMILLHYTLSSRNAAAALLQKNMHAATTTGDSEFGIFRNPGPSERHVLHSIEMHETLRQQDSTSGPPDTAPVPMLLPLLFTHRGASGQYLLRCIEFCRIFSGNTDTIAGAMVFLHILSGLMDSGDPRRVHQHTSHLLETAGSLSSDIFSRGLNPDTIIDTISTYHDIFSIVQEGTSLREAESLLLQKINPLMKTPVTRATVNHPLLLIPYSYLIAMLHADEPGNSLYTALREGGHTTLLCMLTGIFSGALYGGTEWIPEPLREGLINKSRIRAIGTALMEDRKLKDTVEMFIQSEHALTEKALEEYNAKTRHNKQKTKKPKNRNDQERDLSRHVVESWTKVDKAKWKKQKKKQDDHNI